MYRYMKFNISRSHLIWWMSYHLRLEMGKYFTSPSNMTQYTFVMGFFWKKINNKWDYNECIVSAGASMCKDIALRILTECTCLMNNNIHTDEHPLSSEHILAWIITETCLLLPSRNIWVQARFIHRIFMKRRHCIMLIYCYKVAAPPLWNKLQEGIKKAPSLSVFR